MQDKTEAQPRAESTFLSFKKKPLFLFSIPIALNMELVCDYIGELYNEVWDFSAPITLTV